LRTAIAGLVIAGLAGTLATHGYAGRDPFRALKPRHWLVLAPMDQRPGPEVVVANGHGASTTRLGFFAYRSRRLVRLKSPDIWYGGPVTYPVGIDCSHRGEPGKVVWGSAGMIDRRGLLWAIDRRFYLIRGRLFVQIHRSQFRLRGRNAFLRFHEFRDGGGAWAFPTCAVARNPKGW
jgi:hypothetical protein